MGTKATLNELVKEAEKEAENMRGENKGKLWEGRRIRMNNDEEGGKRNTRSAETGRKPNRKEVRSEEENISSFSSRNPLPPIFENVAICMACGKEKHVNVCGMCVSCWVTFAHLRKFEGGEKC